HREVQEKEVLRGLTAPPAESGDLVADLLGPPHVVVPDGPQMRGLCHCLSSACVGITSIPCFDLVHIARERPAWTESILATGDRRWSLALFRRDLVSPAKSQPTPLPGPGRKGRKSLASSAVALRRRTPCRFRPRSPRRQYLSPGRRRPLRSAAARRATTRRGNLQRYGH